MIPRSIQTIAAVAAKVLYEADCSSPSSEPPLLVDDHDHPHTLVNPDFLDGVVQMTARMIGRGDVDTYELILKASE